MTKIIGTDDNKGSGFHPGSFLDLYAAQIEFQRMLLGINVPSDDVQNFSYHVQAIVEELGEVLKADKRWKTHRNNHHDPVNKAEELADVFITAFNLAIYSGIGPNEMYMAIEDKILENVRRVKGG